MWHASARGKAVGKFCPIDHGIGCFGHLPKAAEASESSSPVLPCKSTCPTCTHRQPHRGGPAKQRLYVTCERAFPSIVPSFGCGSKNRYQNGTLVSGNMDQHLRNPSSFIVSHTHFGEAFGTGEIDSSLARPLLVAKLLLQLLRRGAWLCTSCHPPSLCNHLWQTLLSEITYILFSRGWRFG